MMQRALKWLNLYSRQAVRHKVWNSQKCFFYVLGHIWAYVTTICVEQNQCPSHHSIPLTQGLIHDIFTKNIDNWWFWKITFFWVGHVDFFSKKKFDSSPWILATNCVLEWMGLKFYDYDGLQPNISPPKHFSQQCTV